MSSAVPASVVVKKPGRHAVSTGHPWLRSDSVTANEALADGEVVEILDQEGNWLARGI